MKLLDPSLDAELLSIDAAIDAARLSGDLEAERLAWLARPCVTLLRDGAAAARGELQGLRLVDSSEAGEPFQGLLRSRASLDLATLMTDLGHPGAAAVLLNEAESAGIRSAHVPLLRAQIAARTGQLEAARHQIADALSQAAQDDSLDVLFGALLLLAEITPSKAFDALATAAPLAEVADPTAARRFVVESARFAARDERVDDAESLLHIALAGADAAASVQIAELLVGLGRFHAAIPAIDRAISLCEAEDRDRLLGRACIAAGLAAPPGDHSRALLETSLSLLAGSETLGRPWAHLALAERLASSDMKSAEKHLAHAWELVRQRQEPELWSKVDIVRARIAEAEGRSGDAEAREQAATSRANEAGLGALTPRAERRNSATGGAPPPPIPRRSPSKDTHRSSMVAVLIRRAPLPTVLKAIANRTSGGGLARSLAAPLALRARDTVGATFDTAVAVAAQEEDFRRSFLQALDDDAPIWLGEERDALFDVLQIGSEAASTL